MISAHTFAYILLDAMIPQEADQTHIEYGFPVIFVSVNPLLAARLLSVIAELKSRCQQASNIKMYRHRKR